MRGQVASLSWALSFLCMTVSSQSLPYNPTTLLLPQSSKHIRDTVYAFVPASDSQSQQQFVSINISSSISTSNLSVKTITTSLPFPNDESSAIIPSISSTGEISVYAGSCSSTGSELWRYTPSNSTASAEGMWAQQNINKGSDVRSTAATGAEFLSRAFSFSAFVNTNASEANIYVFGGQCPGSESTTSTWQSSAIYSNTMLRFGPGADDTYTLGVPTSRGPPIPEAGFTVTGLLPKTSNGSGVLTQQQNFVLLGGHTQTAFINTSQVAIWSLPEESWSFVTLMSPSNSNGNTELAIKSTVTSIDSRSGHTAVLTEDGSSIIVYGGWVGNVGQAADPQLAILTLGAGFGGSGDWQWIVPDNQPGGKGVYGHGAVMLPGNVMMVLGGYEVASGNSKRQQRLTNQAKFLNVTSMAWVSDYTNPNYVAAIASKVASDSSSRLNSKKIGLGAGLGLGLAAIIGAIIFFCWYRRRIKRRESRDNDIRGISAVGGNHYATSGEMAQRNGGFPWTNGRWNNNDNTNQNPAFDSNSSVSGYEDLQSGVHNLGDNSMYPPPPKQISRKPLHSRNARGYQPTPTFDFGSNANHGRANSLGTAGPIHPIYEADEDQLSRKSNEAVQGVGIALGDPGQPSAKRYSDPFRDPPVAYVPSSRRDRTVSTPEPESPAQSREREIQEWVSDWAAADALLNSQARSHSTAGRLSPTRRAQLIAASTVSSMAADEDSGRTASNLSDGSIAISAMSISRSGSSSQGRSSRNNSLRGFITNAMSPFSAGLMSSTAPSTTLSPVYDNRQLPPVPRSAGSTTSSFTTANTSFHALQVEGETLLPRPEQFYSGENSPTRSEQDAPGSPSKNKAIGLGKGRGQTGQMGWLGSLRRVFEHGNNSDPNFELVPSRDLSPVRSDHGVVRGAEPRRTMSASATLWRRKQGRGDWEDSAQLPSEQNTRSNTFTNDGDIRRTGDGHAPSESLDEEEDWDIERAIQNRVVQVMFTVPKERLRVVNHNVDDDLSEVGSLRSKGGSGKSIKVVGVAKLESLGEVVGERVDDVPDISPAQSKGKGKERASVTGDVDSEHSPSRGKGRSKVLEMVEQMEGRSSPEH